MMFKVLLLLGLVGSLHALARDCIEVERSSGLSNSFQENIAHAIHTSMDWGLPFFNPRVAAKDVLPYVLKGLSSKKVSTNEKHWEINFASQEMRTLDRIMSLPKKVSKRHGTMYGVVHNFHMLDLLERIRQEYNSSLLYAALDRHVCSCLLNIGENGITEKLHDFSQVYASADRFTLTDQPLPQLTTLSDWSVWKKQLLYYYSKPALRDAAMFLHCATTD